MANNIINANNIITCVSGFWPIKNKHGAKFLHWFKTSLRVNCPYIIFSSKAGIELIKTYRLDLPTHYIECTIEEFYTYQYKAKMLIHPEHCPSVELNLIWHEKMFFLEKALLINPFQSEFFCWADAGLCVYREKAPPLTPFPDVKKMLHLPLPKDKFIYSSSNPWRPSEVTSKNYYHYIAGSAYILHANIIPPFVALYKAYLQRIFNGPTTTLWKENLWTDQVLLTHMFKAYPHRFYKLGEGYGNVMLALS